uniref:Uncharacterized protein n=1 Tax=Rhizophora mucronata TaxID=61149 RepID=A0A2P2NPQ5_RHIMU
MKIRDVKLSGWVYKWQNVEGVAYQRVKGFLWHNS